MNNGFLQELYSLKNSSSQVSNFEQAKQIHALLEFPSRKYKTIHVAGTNGKGSVCTKIAKALSLSGYNVGLFTSPHIYTYNERIQINGKPVEMELIYEAYHTLMSLLKKEGLQSHFFEITTFLALLIFKKSKIDIAVIETGIGGHFDTTNVIDPVVSIITTLGMDHLEMLGDNLDAIAFQKGGIIKESVPVVIGPKANHPVIRKIANEKNAPLSMIKDHFDDFDKENIALAKRALQVLQNTLRISNASIEKGLSATPPCRFEIINSDSVQIILDGAHNIQAMESLYQKVFSLRLKKTPLVFLAMQDTKDKQGCLHFLHAKSMDVICPNLNTFESDLEIAFSKAKAQNRQLLITGSFYYFDRVKRLVQKINCIREHI